MKKKIAGIAFVLLSIAIMSVSAYVYESGQQTVSSTVINIVTLNLKNSALGNVEEGQTFSYDKNNMTNFGAAISLTTAKPLVYLHLDSDIQNLNASYATYTLTVRYITVPGGSARSVGGTAATLTILAPDPAPISLDLAGSWAFDFELTATAKSVTLDQTATATIVVTAEST